MQAAVAAQRRRERVRGGIYIWASPPKCVVVVVAAAAAAEIFSALAKLDPLCAQPRVVTSAGAGQQVSGHKVPVVGRGRRRQQGQQEGTQGGDPGAPERDDGWRVVGGARGVACLHRWGPDHSPSLALPKTPCQCFACWFRPPLDKPRISLTISPLPGRHGVPSPSWPPPGPRPVACRAVTSSSSTPPAAYSALGPNKQWATKAPTAAMPRSAGHP